MLISIFTIFFSSKVERTDRKQNIVENKTNKTINWSLSLAHNWIIIYNQLKNVFFSHACISSCVVSFACWNLWWELFQTLKLLWRCKLIRESAIARDRNFLQTFEYIHIYEPWKKTSCLFIFSCCKHSMKKLEI